MLKCTHIELNNLIKSYYDKKLALFVFGAFGIGKSFVVRDTAKELSMIRKREFVEWNKLSREKKQKVYDNPEKYFVLIDERLSESDPTDIKGLPSLKNNEDVINWKIPFWAKFISLENSDGVIFFDEVNLAPPLVISSVYKIIYDRIINDVSIGNNWLIMGAGNRDNDQAFTHTLPAPVRDRGGEVELVSPSIKGWSVWAIKNNIDSKIIAFLNFKSGYMNHVDFNDGQKFTTTRGWERLSCLIKDEKLGNKFELICCSAIGEGIAREFIAFCKIQEKLNLEDIIKNPDKIKEVDEISKKYFIVSAFAEKYKDKKINFDIIMKASQVLDEIDNVEFVALLWKMSSGYTKDFEKKFMKSEKFNSLIEKYSRYLIN